MTTRKGFAVSMTLAVVMVVSGFHSSLMAAEGDVTFGGQWWDQTVLDAKFQEFSEVPRGSLMESFLLREWSGRNSVALWGANAFRGDQASRLTWANGARWRADLGYTSIPHTFSHLARWGLTNVAAGVYTVPDSLQARNQAISSSFTQRMQDFLRSAPVIGLGFNTGISTARLRARPWRGVQLEARGAVRERSGNKPYGLTFGSPGGGPVLENPEPIDQKMVDADLIADFQKNDLSVQASGGISVFDNGIERLLVDNPARITPQSGNASLGALALYPDNQVIRGSLALGYLLPRRSAVAATVGFSQGKQDQDFLPYTSNTALGPSSRDSLPVKSLDGKATQLNGDVRLTTSPVEGLDGSLRFNYADFENQTEEHEWGVRIPYDASIQRFTVGGHENHIYSNTQWRGGLDLDYAATSMVKVGATFEYRDRERTTREVEKDTETIFGGRARVRPLDEVQIEARYRRGDRKLDAFLAEHYQGLRTRLRVGATSGVYDSLGQLENAALRRFDVADRTQDLASAGVSYAFRDLATVSASYSYLKNDYTDSELGLKDETEHTVAGTGTIHVNDQLDLTGGYGFGLTETNQNSRQSGLPINSEPSNDPRDNWSANIEDTDVYVSAGVEWWVRPEKLSIAADYEFSRHLQKFHFTASDSVASPVDLPSTLYRRHDVKVDASYRWLKNMTIIGRYAWQEYDVIDFANNNVPLVFPPTGTATTFYLGDSSQGYKAHRVALLAKWTF